MKGFYDHMTNSEFFDSAYLVKASDGINDWKDRAVFDDFEVAKDYCEYLATIGIETRIVDAGELFD